MTAPETPAAPEVETPRLREALDGLLSAASGRRVADLSRRPTAYYSSFRMEDLDVRLDDDTLLALVFKDLSPGAMLHDASRCKPQFLLDPRREIAVYRHLLRPHGLGPRFFGAVEDAAAGVHWLFVERVDGVPLWQVGELTIWQEAARWAARMHRRFENVPVFEHCPLIRYDEPYYRRWVERAACRFSRHGTNDPLWNLLDRYDDVVCRLTRLPGTFIHGEYHPSNVLIAPASVCPVDWEMAAVGPALMDLADLTAGNWTEAQRDEIVAAYRQEAPAQWSDQDLDFCRLHRAVQWLGWSDEWTPPREHAQDWLAEAVRLARKLGT